jgi:hypothetical protein
MKDLCDRRGKKRTVRLKDDAHERRYAYLNHLG